MMNESTTPVAKVAKTQAERLLTAAGIDFTQVVRCPIADCPVCARTRLRAVA